MSLSIKAPLPTRIHTHNNFILSCFSMSTLKFKVLVGAAMFLDLRGKEEPGGMWVEMHQSELDALVGIKKTNYQYLDAITDELQTIQVRYKDPQSKNFRKTIPIPIVEYKNGVIRLFFINDTLPLFLNLQKNYTNWMIETFRDLFGEYSLRFYGVLVMQNGLGKETFEYTVEELRLMFTDPKKEEKIQAIIKKSKTQENPNTYTKEQFKKNDLLFMDYQYIMRRIESAKKELDKVSNLTLEIVGTTPFRGSKKIEKIKFRIKKQAKQASFPLVGWERDDLHAWIRSVRANYQGKALAYGLDKNKVLYCINSNQLLTDHFGRIYDKEEALNIYSALFRANFNPLLPLSTDKEKEILKFCVDELVGLSVRANSDSEDERSFTIEKAFYDDQEHIVKALRMVDGEWRCILIQPNDVKDILRAYR